MRHRRSENLLEIPPSTPEAKGIPMGGPRRDCRVSFRDRAAVTHSVIVSAVNRYHAFGLALNEMQRCSWSNADQVDKMTIELMNARWRRIVVTREQFDAWLGTSRDAQRKKDRLRLHLLMLLRRMPPDRNFQRWLSRRSGEITVARHNRVLLFRFFSAAT